MKFYLEIFDKFGAEKVVISEDISANTRKPSTSQWRQPENVVRA